jgi:tRNA(fMet)-specific endonuclease VapC
VVHRNRLTRRVVASYAFLEQIFRDLQRFNVAAYDDAAEGAFTALPAGTHTVGVQDRRVAATALARKLIVVTRNARDFARIPGVEFVDWTAVDLTSSEGRG